MKDIVAVDFPILLPWFGLTDELKLFALPPPDGSDSVGRSFPDSPLFGGAGGEL